jgi:hypothetical protein
MTMKQHKKKQTKPRDKRGPREPKLMPVLASEIGLTCRQNRQIRPGQVREMFESGHGLSAYLWRLMRRSQDKTCYQVCDREARGRAEGCINQMRLNRWVIQQ